MEGSQYLEKAKAIVENAKQTTYSIEERRELAIELASLILNEARRTQTALEHRQQAQLAKMMEDPKGKVFATVMADECFRCENTARVADQLSHLIQQFGVPRFASYWQQLGLLSFKYLGTKLPWAFVPAVKYMLRQESKNLILPGERKKLTYHIEKRRKQGVRVNLNHLGEAILGENEADKRLQLYLNDLSRPEVEYISVKVSTICSQLNLLAWTDTLHTLQKRLKQLYRAAMQHTFVRPDGKCVPKFVNLDMEEYGDLGLTVELFRQVLDDPEFFRHSAGIVLQSYLPDSYLIQQQLTVWAMQRVANGGAPIKIRIVKGANLAMERVESAIRGWPQAPYTSKAEVDANFKRMLGYALKPEHARAVHIGIGSHNLFDIAYCLLLRAENQVEQYVEFEMLEGMADHMRRIVQEIGGGMLLYCPAATEKDFHNAIAYLIRRLDENSAPENFLRHSFGLIPGTKDWQEQVNRFSLACHGASGANISPRRKQNRFQEFEKEQKIDYHRPFSNEPDTNWSLVQNRKWIETKLQEWKKRTFEDIPLVIGGQEYPPGKDAKIGRDPSCPQTELYRYALADLNLAETALKTAVEAHKEWSSRDLEDRDRLLATLAQKLRERRGDFIGAMVADGGKTVPEADLEFSEAIDFIEYYRENRKTLQKMEGIEWESKGVVLITPPWNFPCSIPMGGIAAALASGNSVIFKPAKETAYVGWMLASLCWEVGIPKETLQFLLCNDETVGSQLIRDTRVSTVVLTGATSTAQLMLNLRPGIDLIAETGGKNALIISSMSDRDLAIKDLITSAFGHAGQKCSACSLAICLPEVYDDPHFRETLRDAVESLKVGSVWDLSTKVNPLIREPGDSLHRGLTTLEEGEEWLLKPQQHPENPQLWSPGIKLGVRKGSFTHLNELFGPVLGLVRAKNLEEALEIANATPYGLTSGIHTLDAREKTYWEDHIEAGNCYINRTITGAIVQRQPFGGCKASSFGPGAKAGGPNYLMQMMIPNQVSLPTEKEALPEKLNGVALHLDKIAPEGEKHNLWQSALGNYVHTWNNYFSKRHDPSRLLGQDNIFTYKPIKNLILRLNNNDDLIDILLAIAGAQLCNTPLEVSGEKEIVQKVQEGEWTKFASNIYFLEESETAFLQKQGAYHNSRIRFITPPSETLQQGLAEVGAHVQTASPLPFGRIELLRSLREVSISYDYHRNGNLGIRENEERSPVL